jgi:diguanylate cyclase (GGDEF)-like protein/PAS domain S-box-containing protein
MSDSTPFGTSPEATASVLSAVVENAGMGILLVGDDGIPFRINPAFCRLLGYSEAELADMSFVDFTHPDDARLDWELYTSLRAGDRDRYQIDKRYLRRDGGIVWVSLTVSAVRRPDGELLFVVSLVEDITERRRLQEELRRQAVHDHLTGLPNRRLFDDRLEHALTLARRNGQDVTVVLVDLDGFKAVNDAHGHAAGDQVLRVVAQRLSTLAREGDTVARLGGDEFAMLFEGAEVQDHVEGITQRIAAAFLDKIPLAGGQVAVVAASIGVASASQDGGTPEELLQAADARMYVRKRASRAAGHERT